MSSEHEGIRAATRVALPNSDSYLFRLGTALYGFASINSFMTEIITYLDPEQNRDSLHSLVSGKVLDRFRFTVKRWEGPSISEPASKVATEFERLNTERSDFIHAYPITNVNGEQILHRRVDSKNKNLEVNGAFLDDFISRLELVSDGLDQIRGIVRPEL